MNDPVTIINVNEIMYIFDCLRMYIFVISDNTYLDNYCP